MKSIIEGRVFVLGDNIDTDQIIPAEHLVYRLSDPEERKLYGKFAMSGTPIEQSGLPEGNVPFIVGARSASSSASWMLVPPWGRMLATNSRATFIVSTSLATGCLNAWPTSLP